MLRSIVIAYLLRAPRGDGARLSAGGWDETVRRLSAVLPDEKILAEVIDFLLSHGEAVPGGERYASAEQLYIL